MRDSHGPVHPTDSWGVFAIAFFVLLTLLLLVTSALR
jgi:hypothetical protein